MVLGITKMTSHLMRMINYTEIIDNNTTQHLLAALVYIFCIKAVTLFCSALRTFHHHILTTI